MTEDSPSDAFDAWEDLAEPIIDADEIEEFFEPEDETSE